MISSVLRSVWGSTEHPTLGMAVGGAEEDTGGEAEWPEGSWVRGQEGGRAHRQRQRGRGHSRAYLCRDTSVCVCVCACACVFVHECALRGKEGCTPASLEHVTILKALFVEPFLYATPFECFP